MTKVSVILPVYGVAGYIERCTQSLLDQTLQEMEFLFVDDHGPDNSIELVQKMIENHPRKDQFIFLKPEHNMGAGMARNFAIPHAKGEYIAFVDSDDWIEPTMFEELYNGAKKQNSDLCCCQAFKDYTDNSNPTEILRNPKVEDGAFSHDKKAFFLTHYVSLFWTFVFKRELIIDNDIRYPEDRSADDSFFVSCALMMAKSIVEIDKPFYHYLIRPGSVCTTKDSSKFQKRLIVFGKMMDYAKKHNVYDEFQNEIDFMYIKKGYLNSVFNYVLNSLEPQNENIELIYNELLNQVPEYRNNSYFKKSTAYRVLDTMIRKTPKLAVKAIRIYAKKANIVM